MSSRSLHRRVFRWQPHYAEEALHNTEYLLEPPAVLTDTSTVHVRGRQKLTH